MDKSIMQIGSGSTTQSMRKGTAFLAAAVLVIATAGCGNGLAQVSGAVTLDGQPLRGGNGVRATVFFQPASGDGRAAVGILDENGQFQLSSGSEEGVAPGEYLVSCTATQIIPSKNPGGTPSGKRITPQIYASARTSGFQFKVEPGGNEFNLTLSSNPKAGPQARLE